MLNDTPQPSVVRDHLLAFQTTVRSMLMQHEPAAHFTIEPWQHTGGGGGITCVLEQGCTFDKAGVNFSHVTGSSLPPAATAKRPEWQHTPFQAMGVSVVVHPKNPMVPTAHANVRLLLVETASQPVWWFGGGLDLTPYYPFDDDNVLWHQHCHRACKPYGPAVYAQFKAQCDQYFVLPHRNETRGIGGLFFDDLNAWGWDASFAFIRDVGQAFVDAYRFIIEARASAPYTAHQVAFQRYRRGRYVEFNLLYDRGTLFGLQSKGRTASILMSLPPIAHWPHAQEDFQADAAQLAPYLTPRDWYPSR